MENFEQAKISAAMNEESRLSPATLLPLAHSDKRAAETRSLVILLGSAAIALLSWTLGLSKVLGTLGAYAVCAVLFFTAAYLIRGARRKREIAALSVATLEDASRLAPEKIRRDLVQKLFADHLRRGAKARVGLKRGARPYIPQEKPGWKSVDYMKLFDLSATKKKNRGDRAAVLYRMAAFGGSCFVGRFIARSIERFIVNRFSTLRAFGGAHPLRYTLIMALIVLAVAFCLTFILMRRYWISLSEVYAYGVDCEKDSYYAAWNEATHLHALMARSDADQKEDGSGNAGRRRHRGGRGKKPGGQNNGNQTPKSPESK